MVWQLACSSASTSETYNMQIIICYCFLWHTLQLLHVPIIALHDPSVIRFLLTRIGEVVGRVYEGRGCKHWGCSYKHQYGGNPKSKHYHHAHNEENFARVLPNLLVIRTQSIWYFCTSGPSCTNSEKLQTLENPCPLVCSNSEDNHI